MCGGVGWGGGGCVGVQGESPITVPAFLVRVGALHPEALEIKNWTLPVALAHPSGPDSSAASTDTTSQVTNDSVLPSQRVQHLAGGLYGWWRDGRDVEGEYTGAEAGRTPNAVGETRGRVRGGRVGRACLGHDPAPNGVAMPLNQRPGRSSSVHCRLPCWVSTKILPDPSHPHLLQRPVQESGPQIQRSLWTRGRQMSEASIWDWPDHHVSALLS